MPNHVHLLVVPNDKEGLSRAIGEVHRRYTRRINFWENWRGHLWQECFASFPLDEKHLLAVIHYIVMNPVAAGLAGHPGDYRCSCARAYLENIDDGLTTNFPKQTKVGDWAALLNPSTKAEAATFQQHERTGRPLGGMGFGKQLEQSLNRIPGNQNLKKKRNGR